MGQKKNLLQRLKSLNSEICYTNRKHQVKIKNNFWFIDFTIVISNYTAEKFKRNSVFFENTDPDDYEIIYDYKEEKKWPRSVKYENEIFSISSIEN